TARLAVRQLVRHPTRSSLTVGVLFAALTAGLSFGTSFLNNLDDIEEWFTESIGADFIIRAAPVDPAIVVAPAPLPADLLAVTRDQSGHGSSWRFRFVRARADGLSALVIVRDFEKRDSVPLAILEGEKDAGRRLHRGEAVLGSPLAKRLGVGVGDTITLSGPTGRHSVRVAAVGKEYTVGGLALYLEWT